jgi:predicted Zn finger-like uncharacterized protein
MLIVCESCETRFRFNEKLLPEEGARVRCSRCQHRFHVAPPSADPSESAAPTGPEHEPAGERPAEDSPPVEAARPCVESEEPGFDPESHFEMPEHEYEPSRTVEPVEAAREPEPPPAARDEEPDLENPEFIFDARRGAPADEASVPESLDEGEEAPPLLAHTRGSTGQAPRSDDDSFPSEDAFSLAEPGLETSSEPEAHEEDDALLDPAGLDLTAAPQPTSAVAPEPDPLEKEGADPPLLEPASAGAAPEGAGPPDAETAWSQPQTSASVQRPVAADAAHGAEASDPESVIEPQDFSDVVSETDAAWAGEGIFGDDPGDGTGGEAIEILPGRVPGGSPSDFAPATPPTRPEARVPASSLLDSRQSGSRLWVGALALSALLALAGGRTLLTLARGDSSAHPAIEAAGWRADAIEAFHVRDATGRRVLVLRGALESPTAAAPPVVALELRDGSGEPVGATSIALLTRLPDRELSAKALAKRLTPGGGAIGRGGQIDGFTLLVPDPPLEARSYRLSLLGS